MTVWATFDLKKNEKFANIKDVKSTSDHNDPGMDLLCLIEIAVLLVTCLIGEQISCCLLTS